MIISAAYRSVDPRESAMRRIDVREIRMEYGIIENKYENIFSRHRCACDGIESSLFIDDQKYMKMEGKVFLIDYRMLITSHPSTFRRIYSHEMHIE